MKYSNLLGAAAAYLTLLAGPSSMADAKEHLVVKEDLNLTRHEKPLVQALRDQRCLVSSDDTEVCMKYDGNLTVGWEWEQIYDDRRELSTTTTDDSKYELSINIYSQQKIGLGFLVNLLKFIYLEIAGEIDDFKISFRFKSTYYLTSRRTCFNLSYFLDDFQFATNMNMRLGECYKNVIDLFYAYDNWADKYAKWYDICRLSSATNVPVYSYEYVVNESEKYITALGDGTDTKDGCKPGLFWTGGLKGTLHHNAMVYFMDKMGEIQDGKATEATTVNEAKVAEPANFIEEALSTVTAESLQ